MIYSMSPIRSYRPNLNSRIHTSSPPSPLMSPFYDSRTYTLQTSTSSFTLHPRTSFQLHSHTEPRSPSILQCPDPTRFFPISHLDVDAVTYIEAAATGQQEEWNTSKDNNTDYFHYVSGEIASSWLILSSRHVERRE